MSELPYQNTKKKLEVHVSKRISKEISDKNGSLPNKLSNVTKESPGNTSHKENKKCAKVMCKHH